MNRFCLSLLCFVLFLSGCSLNSSPNIRKDLANQGPLVVVPGNSFIAANILLEQERKKSPVLRGFLEENGDPDVLEIKMGSAPKTSLDFFYVKRKVKYNLMEGTDDWIIGSPLVIPSNQLAELERFIAFGSVSHFSMDDAEVVHLDPKKDRVLEEIPALEPLPGKARPLPSPVPVKESVAPATQTPRVDVRHTVQASNQSLKDIVIWYTGDAGNVAKILRINQLPDDGSLAVGKEILIPGYLVKKNQPMPVPNPAASAGTNAKPKQ